MQNKEIRFANRPSGLPTVDNFQIAETTISHPNQGDVLLRTIYISVDPYLRGRMREGRSYIAPFELGQPVMSGIIAEVVESNSNAFQPGEIVLGQLPWALYSIAMEKELRKINPKLAPITTALGILGMPGITAYFGLLDVGKPIAGDTVVVSGAAGAVGTVVCQIAKIVGCRVIGIAGSDEKCRYLRKELGVDVALNYKKADGPKTTLELRDELSKACPQGVNVYFDNVGGDISDAVLMLLAKNARVPICGQISAYNLDRPDAGLRPQVFLLINQAMMKGFMVTDYTPRADEAIRQMGQWLAEGKLKYAETIVEGFENTPGAFIGLFKGENLGKAIVKVV